MIQQPEAGQTFSMALLSRAAETVLQYIVYGFVNSLRVRWRNRAEGASRTLLIEGVLSARLRGI